MVGDDLHRQVGPSLLFIGQYRGDRMLHTFVVAGEVVPGVVELEVAVPA